MLPKSDTLSEQALREENNNLQQLLLKQEEESQLIISKIAHEIRNPLTLINSSLQLIEAQHPEVKAFAHWSQTLDDIQYLKTLLNELSFYNNGTQLNKVLLCPMDLVQSAAKAFQASLENSNKKIHVSTEPDLRPILADEVKMRQVMTNLIKNAIEAIPAEGDIHIRITSDTENLSISVKDNGCGIPSDHIKDLYTPFVTHKQNGTGLGLSISKRIIEAHGGSISVDSSDSLGTTFCIILPYK